MKKINKMLLVRIDMYKFILGRVFKLLNVIKNNWAYLVWFAFYVFLFSVLTGGIALFFYIVTVPLALMPIAEKLWRKVTDVRPLVIKSEKDRLLPLFEEVYQGAVGTNPKLSRKIKLYIVDDMTINAFAFGKSTLILTRGSIMLLSDECLKGLMAHEFGHFSYRHTDALLLFTVANLPMSFIIRKLTNFRNNKDNRENRGSIVTGVLDTMYYFFKTIDFVGELILTHFSRRGEYMADKFSSICGFGEELANVLREIYSVSINKPQSIKERLRSTHPQITKRIERLEDIRQQEQLMISN
jgi:Zn-dependent protease with chaperone function